MVPSGRASILALVGALVALPACERPPAPTASSAAPKGAAAPPGPSTTTSTGAPGRPANDPAGIAPRAALPAGVVEGEAAGVHYLERATGGGKLEDRLPMVVMIHGLGDRPESFLDALAGVKTPARLILPRGLEAHGGGWAWFPYRREDPQVMVEGIRNATGRISGALTELSARRPTAGRPIVSGFSQGGMISFALAALFPAAVSAAYPLSGMLPPPLRPSAPARGPTPPVVAFHGDADKMVPIEPSRESIAALKAQGWSAELRESPGTGHTVTQETRQALTALVDAAAARAAAAP